MNPTYSQLAKMIDHALLHPTLTDAEAVAGCEMAVSYDIATVCVKPYWVPRASEVLAGTDVLVSCVVGFPAGNSSVSIKQAEAAEACQAGAREIDMVINIAKALEADWNYVEKELGTLVKTVHDLGAKIKIIFETDYLKQDSTKITLCEICGQVSADWVKTSTGFGYVKQANGALVSQGATEHDLRLMRGHSPAHVQVKASGGVRDLPGLLRVRELGCTRLGTSATKAILDAYQTTPPELLACISHTFRREAQCESCSHKEDAAFPAGQCVNTLSEEKSKSDAVDAGLPQAAAKKCEKCGLAHLTEGIVLGSSAY